VTSATAVSEPPGAFPARNTRAQAVAAVRAACTCYARARAVGVASDAQHHGQNSGITAIECMDACVGSLLELCGALGRQCARDTRQYAVPSLGRQRWDHLQAWCKDTRISSGVVLWHVQTRALLNDVLAGAENTEDAPVADELGATAAVYAASAAVTVLESASASLADLAEFYTTVVPSRARTAQYAADIVSVAAATCQLLNITSSLASGADAAGVAPELGDVLAASRSACQLHVAHMLAAAALVAAPAAIVEEILVVNDAPHCTFAAVTGAVGEWTASESALAVASSACGAVQQWLANGSGTRHFRRAMLMPEFVPWADAQLHRNVMPPAAADHALLLRALRLRQAAQVAGPADTAPAGTAVAGGSSAAARAEEPSQSIPFPWCDVLAPQTPGGGSTARACLLDPNQVAGLVARRHELGDWEWPLLTTEQERDGAHLRAALAAFRSRHGV
jgi:hypothetical protein